MRLVLFATAMAFSAAPAASYTISDASDAQISDRGALQLVLARISDQFRDPDSVQFRRLRAGKGALCGEVNAKNVFGGYEGFQPFFQMDAFTDWPGALGIGQASPVCD